MRLSDDEILKFDELINSLVEGSISETEREDLEQWLIRSKAARRRYIKFMDMSASLHHYAAEFQGAIPDDDPEGYSPDSQSGTVVPQTVLKSLVAIAAAIVLGFVALNFLPKSEPPKAEAAPEPVSLQPQTPSSLPMVDGVAILTQAWGLEWDDPDSAVKTGRELPKGVIDIAEGLAQLEFKSGAIVIIEGPAKFDLQSKDAAFCHFGKIRAIVPHQATGFQISAKQLEVIDLGTEFAMNVSSTGEIEVVVYEGKVELHKNEAKPGDEPEIEVSELNAGESIFVDSKGKIVKIDMPKSEFIGAAGLAERSIEELQARYSRWVEHSEEMREDERLLLYYTFDNEQAWSRNVTDQALNKARSSNGALIGCEWVQGRWPGKGALHFKRGSDRVRIDIPGLHESMSFATWVRLDRLNYTTTSLFLCASENPGAPHWQVDNEGRMLLSIKGPARRQRLNLRNPPSPPKQPELWVYQTDKVLHNRLGEWSHLVTVYDHQNNVVRHHVDGRKVYEQKLRSRTKFSIDKAELGNWPKPDKGHPSTNLRGRIDELAIFNSALSEEEVTKYYEIGRPDALHGWVALRNK